MYACNVLAVSGALIAAVAAVPMAGEHHAHLHQHHQREIVWETATDEVIVTIPVTKTIWIEPGETPAQEPQSYAAPSSTLEAKPAAYSPSSQAAPAPAPPAYTPESSSSVYVAPPAYTPPASSSSSVYVAPPPPAYTPPTSTSVYVAPTPESSYVAPAPTSYAAPAQSSSAPSYGDGGSSSGGALTYGMCKSGTTFTGDLTYYDPGLGACGFTNTTSEPIVAISEKIFDSYTTGGNPNANPLCSKWVTITGPDGRKHKGQIVDRCPGCDTGSLDLTQTFFDEVTVNGDGRVHDITWTMD